VPAKIEAAATVVRIFFRILMFSSLEFLWP
jgi:hypothetical protein